jgi:hypothetical protein
MSVFSTGNLIPVNPNALSGIKNSAQGYIKTLRR